MNEVRLTLRTSDFGAVSRALIDLGVGFSVEPVAAEASESPVRQAARAPAAPRKAAGKAAKGTRGGSRGPKAAALKEAPMSLTERLRAAAARTQPTETAPTGPPDQE